MAEDFNALLDQTETRAQALVLEADKALALIDSVDTMLDNLSSTIEESANKTKAIAFKIYLLKKPRNINIG